MTVQIDRRFTVVQDGTTVHVYHANHGEGLPQHEHVYSHLTFCTSGAIIVRKEGIQHRMDKHSQPVNLKPNEWHEIEALEDDTVFINVFAEGKY